MKTLKRLIAVMMTVLMLLSTFSVAVTASAASKKVKKITLNKTSVTLYVGETLKLKATVSPSNATNKKVTWSSSNKKVATVSSSGKITAKKKGTVTITVKAKDGSGKKATCKVTVKNRPVKSVKLNKKSVTLCTSATVTLKATVSPSNATNKDVTWKSSNKKVATVSSSGKVTAKKKGTATITVTTKDGKKKATCKVKVTSIGVSGLSLSKTSVTGSPGGSITLKATTKPSNADNKKLKWTSSNTKVATVSSSGKVSFLKDGTATITAKTTDGTNRSVTCKVTVKTVKVTSVKLASSTLTGYTGESKTLKATVSPTNATNSELRWTSSDDSVATVDSTGKIRMLKVGTTTITATAKDGSGKKATCKVTVQKLVAYTSTFSWYQGKTGLMQAMITPSGAKANVTWSSSDSKYAKINATTGEVEILKAPGALDFGSKEITFTATDSAGRKATYEITIKKKTAVENMTFTAGTQTEFYVGQKFTPSVTVEPSNASETNATFTSSNEAVAKVLDNGSILMVGEGTAVITATSEDKAYTNKPTLTINVVKPIIEIKGSSTIDCEVGEEISLSVFATPNFLCDTAGLKFEIADESILEYVSTEPGTKYKSGAYYRGSFRVIGDGTTTITAMTKDGKIISTNKVTVEASDISVDTYHEGLEKGETVTIDAKVVIGDKVVEGAALSYVLPYSDDPYIDYYKNDDGKIVVEILKELDRSAYLDVSYKSITKRIYFVKGEYKYPSTDKTQLFNAAKSYLSVASNAKIDLRDKEVEFNRTNVAGSEMDIRFKGTSILNEGMAEMLNAVLLANKDGFLADMDMDSDDMVYELFADRDKEYDKGGYKPKTIGCSVNDIESISYEESNDVTYDIVINLKDQPKLALASIASSAYGKAMPEVIDKAFIDDFIKTYVDEINKEMGANDGNKVTLGAVDQTYKDGKIVVTVNKLTNKVEKCEYYFKTDLVIDDAKMVMITSMDTGIVGVLNLQVDVGADFSTTVEKTLTYHDFAY